jgi:MFS-type transporter involved in bile tolerance (Atg22 family)
MKLSSNTNNVAILLFVLLLIAIIVLGPIATIWSLNTLFPVLAIPYTFDTWVATLLVGAFVRGEQIISRKK